MTFQNRAILSLGSNSGNRQQHIQSAVGTIHTGIATVVRVSAMYETPSWGFDSEDFLNCAVLVHTCKTPKELLDELLMVETAAGRVRVATEGYAARVLDVDIIAFNDDIIDVDHLHIPHPRMQDRNFVMYPLRDVAPGWIHPVLKKDISKLISETSDDRLCTKLMQLIPPLQGLNLPDLNYVAIEGNIGAGKTSLSAKLSEDFNARLVQERFADNPFLPLFYKDQERYAFSLEMSFLADRYQQLSDDLAQFDLFSDFVVADYYIIKSLIFSKITLSEDEYRLYRRLFDIMYKEIPKPGLYVYLYQNTERLLQNIKKRGRSYEQDIKAEYLMRINQGYLDFIKSQSELNVLIIDVTDKDFVNNQSDYIELLQQISAAIAHKQ